MTRRTDRARAAVAQALCGILLLIGGNPLWAQKGYDLRNDQIVVNQARHWQAWTMPGHLVRVARDGAVRARDFRTVYELLADRSFGRPVTLTRAAPRIANMDSTLKLDFQGNSVRDLSGNLIYDYLVRPGVSRAGSNPHLMQHIADGDPDTFWEPDLDDPPEDWWVEVDLGRPVPLERVRLSFAEEALGDPFYRFILLLGPAQGNYADETPGNMETFIPFEGVNTDQRTFVFDAERVSDDPARRRPGCPAQTPAGHGQQQDLQRVLRSGRTESRVERQAGRNHPHRGHGHPRGAAPSSSARSNGRSCRRLSAATSFTSSRTGTLRSQWMKTPISPSLKTGREGGSTIAANCRASPR